jgi:hypothetical protein
MNTIILVILVLILIGVIPIWPHSQEWGPWPGSAVGIVLVILLILFLAGRL